MIDLERLIADAVARELDKRGVKPANEPATHVTVAEYARARSISESTVRIAIREKRLPCIRIGRAVRIPSDVEIARRTTAEDAATARARSVLLRGGKVA